MRYWPQVLIYFCAWLLLAWPAVDPHIDLLVAAGVALLVPFVVGSGAGAPLVRFLDPRRWLWFAVFLAVFALHVIRANFDVARRVLTPSLPIRPGIVKIHSKLKPAVLPLLANAITLTPGTLTVDIGSERGVLYVHCIDVEDPDVQAATEKVAGHLERLIAKIVEGPDAS